MKTNNIISLLNQHKVIIPEIQRDYAQGRNSGKIPHIRKRFLTDLIEVLTKDEKPILELDFVYGYTEIDTINGQGERSYFKPLDGQQRLTTLFLLHWYIATKEGILDDVKSTLLNFAYSTRRSSRAFCEHLVDFQPQFNDVDIQTEIQGQPWFFSAWQSDPTVAGMLVVLNDIESLLGDTTGLWDKLSGDHPRIVFHLLPMEDLGLPDDLYIKMNARGKELTDFEHFKSQFSEILDQDHAYVFNSKIDKEWSDLFWNVFKDKPLDETQSKDIARVVDSGFLSFFWYITDVLIAKNKITIDNSYWINKMQAVYQNHPGNVDFLFKCLDLFEQQERTDKLAFNSIFYLNSEDFEIHKTRLFFVKPNVNLFHKCAETYGYYAKGNSFSIGEQLLLYAFIYMKLNDKFDPVKLRKLRNIFASSEDQLRNEYLPEFLFIDVDSIIDRYEYSANSKLSSRQLKEEKTKDELISVHTELKEIVYRLEDHTLLRGNIAILNIDETLPEYAEQFHKIFTPTCNYFEISRAMLTFDNYTRLLHGWKTRFGNKNNSTWRELLTESATLANFDKTHDVVISYFTDLIENKDRNSEQIVSDFLDSYYADVNKPKEWIYYYIKYQSFILWDENQTSGYYHWKSFDDKPYEFTMMFKTQLNGRHWNPFLLEINSMNNRCTLDNYGDDLQYTNANIILMLKNTNSGFLFYAKDEESQQFLDGLISSEQLDADAILQINQNEDGIDLEDRIIKCNDFLNQIL